MNRFAAARLSALVSSLALAAAIGFAHAQTYHDAGGTIVPAVVPISPPSTAVGGTASQTGTAATTLINANAVGRLRIAAVECGNTSATTTFVTLSDMWSTVLVVPSEGGNNQVYPTPLIVPAGTALTFTPNASVSTIYCSAQGYSSP